MNILATILGLCAVLMFVLSYQLKSRRGSIFFNASSRILYVVQYILIGAFEGTLLDVVAFFVSLLCGAYGSAVGNAITLVSITIAIVHYDLLKKKKSTKENLTYKAKVVRVCHIIMNQSPTQKIITI